MKLAVPKERRFPSAGSGRAWRGTFTEGAWKAPVLGGVGKRVPDGNSRAFTLVEVIAAMTIFSLISVSIFAIIFQTGVEAGSIRDTEARDQQINRFVTLLRETLEAMPSESAVALVNQEEANSGWPELTFSGTPTAFVFGVNPGGDGDSVIGLRPVTQLPPQLEGYPDPLFNISLSREAFATEGNESNMQVRAGADDLFVDEDDDGRRWLPLVENVTALGWRFWDTDELLWVDLDDWSGGDSMPSLLEMTLADPWRPPLRVVFRIPEHAREGGGGSGSSSSNSSPPANSTSTTPSRTSIQPAVRPGGAGVPRDGIRPGGGGRPGGDRGAGGGGRGPGGGGRPDGASGGGRPGGSGGAGGAASGGGGGGR